MSEVLKHKIIDYDFESMGPLDELLDKEAADGWNLLGIIPGIIMETAPYTAVKIDRLIMQKSYPSHPEIN